MEKKNLLQADSLVRYSFLWSELRLIIAAIALIFGGVPPAIYFFPTFYPVVSPLLTLAWIISGVASAYLFYRWNAKKTLFGKKEQKDKYAFFVSVISGLNLGVAGLLGRNIGMSISSSKIIFFLVALIYLASAVYLYKRWNAYKQKLF